MYLSNKTIVITGANGALGKATARKALDHGGSVILLDLDFSDEVKNLARNVTTRKVDLLNPDSLKSQLDDLPVVDAVFNLAGGFVYGPSVHETSDDDWNSIFAINVTTLRNTIHAVVPKMLQQGRGAIVNVGAIGALKGAGNLGAYCASKSVVMRLTESLSEELKEHSINVNAVLPSIIDTPANRAAMPEADPGKWVAPEDLAEVICFLASDGARAIHGALIPVAGLS